MVSKDTIGPDPAKKPTPEIVDRGRGPQLSTSRITAQDLLPFYRQGASYDEIRRWLPSLTDNEIAVLKEYIRCHYDDILAAEQQIKDYHDRMRADQASISRHRNNRSVNDLRDQIKEQLAKRKGQQQGAIDPAR